MSVMTPVIVVIAFAMTFDFLNCFHDSANSIATIVSTRVLTPLQAVIWAAFFNFISAFTFGASDVPTWWLALPTSFSHAIIGGYAGAAMARAMAISEVHAGPHGFLVPQPTTALRGGA
jgi:inorganic phosphate transporter, PiT family